MVVFNTDTATLFNEDCLGDLGMKQIEPKSIDMILCDLPYAITANNWDKGLNLEMLFKEFDRVIKDHGAVVLFGNQPFTTDLINAYRKNFRYSLVWDKNLGTDFFNCNRKPLKSHEDILIFYKKQPTYNPQKEDGKPYMIKQGNKEIISNSGMKANNEIVTINNGTRFPKSILRFSRETGKHTTQKPVKLCEWLIKTYTNEGETVLDATMGSGTTGVACMNTNRQFVGYETDKDYFKIACERIFK